jgi:hypothetical protein
VWASAVAFVVTAFLSYEGSASRAGRRGEASRFVRGRARHGGGERLAPVGRPQLQGGQPVHVVRGRLRAGLGEPAGNPEAARKAWEADRRGCSAVRCAR